MRVSPRNAPAARRAKVISPARERWVSGRINWSSPFRGGTVPRTSGAPEGAGKLTQRPDSQPFRAWLITFALCAARSSVRSKAASITFLLLPTLFLAVPITQSQQSKATVRHHRVERTAENTSPPEAEQ